VKAETSVTSTHCCEPPGPLREVGHAIGAAIVAAVSSPSNAFSWPAQAGLGDVAATGRARLDTLVRWLQDAAHAHVVHLGFGGEAWIVRRTTLTVERFPLHDEPVVVTTWPSGLARLWAQRETTIAGSGGASAHATAIWVHLDAQGRPRPLADDYRAALRVPDGPRVRARLTHPPPPAGAVARSWAFRIADLDMADHVNNAAYWTVLEEDLHDWPADRALEAEVEHPAAAGAGEATVFADGAMRWVVDTGGAVVASLSLSSARRAN
jgi:acyl-ACP thioesterase